MSDGKIVLPSNMPVGFRFHPTEEELISHYLRLKLLGRDSEVNPVIAELDNISDYEPWNLPAMSKIQSEDRMWWFFCRRDGAGKRAKRKTESGFWKVTGLERKVKIMGRKRTLVFYLGSSPGKRTNWVMQHYYSASSLHPHQRDYTICRLKLKSDDTVETPDNPDEGEASDEISGFENPINPFTITVVNEVTAEIAEESAASRFADSLIIDPCDDSSEMDYLQDSDAEGSYERNVNTNMTSPFSFGLSDGSSRPQRQKKMAKTSCETSGRLTVDNFTPETHVALPLITLNRETASPKLILQKMEMSYDLSESQEDRDDKKQAPTKLACTKTSGINAREGYGLPAKLYFTVAICVLLFAVFAREVAFWSNWSY